MTINGEVIRLHENGKSKKEIMKQLGLSAYIVNCILTMHECDNALKGEA